MLTREEKLLLHLRKDGLGVEIGASHAPIAPKRDGYKVHIIDHATLDELVRKYEKDGVKLENIEEVDFVWRGETYAELTGRRHYYDWIIASHVIEHVPDLVGFLNSCDEILKDDGVLSLAIPDVRFCFDRFRPISGLAKVIDAHYQNHVVHTPGSIAEFRLNFVHRDDQPGWAEGTPLEDSYTFIYSRENVLEHLEKCGRSSEYADCHAWCFTPHSFRLLINDLFDLGLIKMREVGFFPSEGCEFHVALSRNGKGSGMDRLELLKAVDEEVARGLEPSLIVGIGLKAVSTNAKKWVRNVSAKPKQVLKKLLGR